MTLPSLPPPVDIKGFTQGGDYVKTIHLTSRDGMRASILTYGARLLDLRLSDNRPLILSFSSLHEIESDNAYVGVAVGRTANRIRGGRLLRDDDAHQHVKLECNEAGRHHAHGGRRAWDKRLFAVQQQAENFVELFLFSPDGDQGYPSSVEVVIRYELTGCGEIAVTLKTTNVGTERTVTNMTIHPYFDLTGQCGKAANSALHYLMWAPTCNRYLVLDDHNCPTGEVAPVANTRYDFRQKRTIGVKGEHPFRGYDQYFVASDESPLDGLTRSLVTINCPAGDYGPGVNMEVLSNQPGFQMYTANGFDRNGPGNFEQYGSVAVEPSGFIDAGNNDGFPTIALEPTQTRRQFIAYRFEKLAD